METLFESPDVAKCPGCGVVSGIVSDIGLPDPLCPSCAKSAWQWEGQKAIADTTSIILGRKPFDCLSREDRQELLNQLLGGIGYIPEAVNADEAEQWLNPPGTPTDEYRVTVKGSNGQRFVIPCPSLEQAKLSVDRLRADGIVAVIAGFLY